MYQVLLVDDEPLILSGIKFLIDWQQNGCQIADTARNGQQALEKIRQLRPDIVICDISMPVLSGTELLRLAASESPATVFIMLTNHPDFDLARESLRFAAVDYLLKSQLSAETLEQSLARACAERDRRSLLAKAELADSYLAENSRQLLDSAILRMVQAPANARMEETAAVLASHHILDGWGMAYIPLRFSLLADTAPAEPQDLERMFQWEQELAEKLAQNLFAEYSLFCPDKQYQSLFLLAWGIPQKAWQEKLLAFSDKLGSTSSTIVQADLRVLGTDYFTGEAQLAECRRQLFLLREHYYLTSQGRVLFGGLQPPAYQPLGLTGLGGRLTAELQAKNAAGVSSLLGRAISRIQDTPHEKSQAVWLCGEVSAAVEQALGADSPLCGQGPRQIEQLATRGQVVRWLEQLLNELLSQLEQYSLGRSALVEKARQYVCDNVEKRIMLQDVAEYVCISPGYLSSLFKKQYNQNLVDYINEVKMERACELIREGRYRIYEISYRMGFENAYYFSRVFKRHVGMTPSEYRKSLGRNETYVE